MGTVLRFLGATGTVTGSRTLVEAGGSRVLVDCGLFQGVKSLRLRNWNALPFAAGSIHAVALTHAHIDHSGAVPLLVRSGYTGPVYASAATVELCRILWPDSARLQEEQAGHANRHGWSRHSPALPLYTVADAERALARLRAVPFDKPFEAAPGVRARFLHSGHILGASSVVVDALARRIVFSGDVGRLDDALMRPPARPPDCDAMVLESTYGDRLHDRSSTPDAIAEVVTRTVARGGTVVVPAFAVGRAQLLLLELARLKAAGRIPRSLPVVLDSPMAAGVSGLYAHYPDEHRLSPGECAMLTHAAREATTPEASRALDQSDFPTVIVAGSGMATGGRVLHHIRRFGPDPRSTILFAGFQAAGTRGASMVQGAREVKMFGEYVPIRAEVVDLEHLSAHADWQELLEWLAALGRAPGRLMLNHGEPAAADALRRRIRERFGWEAGIPEYGESIEA